MIDVHRFLITVTCVVLVAQTSMQTEIVRPPSLVKSMGYILHYICPLSIIRVACLIQLTTSSSSGSEVVDVRVIWSGPGVDPPHAIDTLNDSSGKLIIYVQAKQYH